MGMHTHTKLTMIVIIIILSTPVSATDWTVYKNNPQHTGVANDALEPPLELLWKFKTYGPVVSSPAIYGGVLYFGSGDYYVYAPDSLTGEIKWKFKTNGRVDASPAVWKNTVYVGSLDGKLYALDAKTGRLKWKFETLGQIISSPVVEYGIVFFGSTDGFIYALNATTGEKKWAFKTDGKIEASPAVYGQLLIVGSYDGKIYAFGAKSGGIVWTFNAKEPITSWAVVIDSGIVYAIVGSKYLYALNAATGEVKWKRELGKKEIYSTYDDLLKSEIVSSPTKDVSVVSGMVYVQYYYEKWKYKYLVSNKPSKLYHKYYLSTLDTQNGQIKWKFEVKGAIHSSPTLSGGTVYFGCNDGYLYALHADNGELKWKYLINSSIRSSPVVANGILYIGADNGYLYAFASSELVEVYSDLKELKISINNAKNKGIILPTTLNTAIANAENYIKNGKLDKAKNAIESARATLNELLKAYNSTLSLLSQIDTYIEKAPEYGLNASKYSETRTKIESYFSSGDYEKAETLALQLKLQIENDYKAVLEAEIENITKILEEEKKKGIVTIQIDSLVLNVKNLTASGKYLEALSEIDKIKTEIRTLEVIYAQAKRQLEQVENEYTILNSKGFNVTIIEPLLLNGKKEFEKGDYRKTIELTRQIEVELQNIKNAEAEKANSLLNEVEVKVSKLRQLTDVSKLESEILTAKDKIKSGDYPSAAALLEGIKQKINLIKEANNAILTAEITVNQEREKGFEVSKAENLLKTAKKLFDEGNYEDAKKFAEQASAIAVDIDQDGVPNEEDKFPWINNRYLYLIVGLLIVLGGVGGHIFRKRKHKEKKSVEKRKKHKYESKTIPQYPGSTGEASLSGFPTQLLIKYEPLELLGSGGFARVFKARRKKDGRIVAVKIPKTLDPATGKAFVREISNWLHLKHPNIVELYDVNVIPIPYLEMEYCEGSLAKLGKPMDVEQAAHIIFNIAEGLKYAHKKRIIHRDLKPSNILLKAGIPKISDWGLSKVMSESRSSTLSSFTPYYAAPEQLSPKRFGGTDDRTDIWQLGVLFYELVTGKLPFEGRDLGEVTFAIINENPIPPSEINPEAKIVEPIIMKMLEKDKAKRYQSVEELQKDLARILNITYVEGLKKSRDLKRTVFYIGDLALINLKTGNYKEVLKYFLELREYAGKYQKDLDWLIEQVKIAMEENVNLGEEAVMKADVIVHQIKMGR